MSATTDNQEERKLAQHAMLNILSHGRLPEGTSRSSVAAAFVRTNPWRAIRLAGRMIRQNAGSRTRLAHAPPNWLATNKGAVVHPLRFSICVTTDSPFHRPWTFFPLDGMICLIIALGTCGDYTPTADETMIGGLRDDEHCRAGRDRE